MGRGRIPPVIINSSPLRGLVPVRSVCSLLKGSLHHQPGVCAQRGSEREKGLTARKTNTSPSCLIASLEVVSSSSHCNPVMASQQDSGFFEISIKSLLKSWSGSKYASWHSHMLDLGLHSSRFLQHDWRLLQLLRGWLTEGSNLSCFLSFSKLSGHLCAGLF